MNRAQSIRQQVSELADGELEAQHLPTLLAELNSPAPNTLRADWDLYHRIGDCLRSEQMADELSADFSCWFAERLEAEPTVLAPRRKKVSGRLRGWGVALTAVAAAATGFALSPSLFHTPGASSSTLAAGLAGDASVVRSAVIADASSAMVSSSEPDYILLHQSANPSLYGAPAMVRQAALSSREK